MRSFSKRLCARTCTHGACSEQGTTILETTIAVGLVLMVLVGVGGIAISGLRSVGFARQRDVANSILDQVMEQIRALPFQTVANGLSNSDATVSSDSNISITGTAPNQTYTFVPTSETMPHGALTYTQAPLVPHLTSATVNGTAFTVGVYPTVWSGASGVYRVTAIVSWASSNQPGVPSKVSGQSLVYSPAAGCLSRATHPFSAPCQPFLHGTATTGVGFVKIGPGQGYSGNAIAGIPLNLAQLTLPLANSTTSVEQASIQQGVAKTSGVSLDVSGQPIQTAGTVTQSVAADNDPGTTPNASNTATLAQSGSAVSYTGGGHSITLTPSTTDSGTTTATINAGATPPCQDLAGTTLSSSLPCGSGTLSQSGTTMSASANFGAGIGTATLASVAAQSSATRDFVARLVTSIGGYCTGTSGDGCVHSAANRYVGTVLLAGLPSGITGPAGWAGASCNSTNALLQVTGLNDQVVAESGVSAAAPSATQTSGTFTYWNGTGCTSKTINWGAAPPSVTIPTVTVTSGTTTITMTTTVTLGATSTSTTAPAGCVSVCTARATSAAPVRADIQYVITDSTTTIANLDINCNLGDLAVSSSYQAAPAAG